MAQNDTPNGAKPPYVAYKTLVGTLHGFKDVGVPAQVDNSVLTGKSGSAQSAIKLALEFFGAIEPDGTKTPILDEMVGALSTLEWKTVLRSLLADRYGPIVNGLDLRNGTSRQLERHFAESGVKGSVLRKAIRFYLQALDDAGIPRSPHFKAPAQPPRTSSRSSSFLSDETSQKVEKAMFHRGMFHRGMFHRGQKGEPEREQPRTTAVPEGMEQVAINLPGRSEPCVLTFHKDIRQREWEHVVSQLQGYWLLKSDPADDDD